VRLAVAGLLWFLSTPSLAQSSDGLAGCVYPKDVPEQAAAEKIMPLGLPYFDKQFVYYRDGNGQRTGAYAVRRSLRIYFYDKDDVLMGTAIRRSQAVTSYFEPGGTYLGSCTNHKLEAGNRRAIVLAPGAN
jgi:hypothetical protein